MCYIVRRASLLYHNGHGGMGLGPLSSLQVERIGGELVGGKFGLSQFSTVGTGRNSYCHDFKFLPQQLNNIKEYSQQDATHI